MFVGNPRICLFLNLMTLNPANFPILFFQITNAGPSSIASAKIQLLWPLRLESGELLFGLDDVVTVGPVKCNAAHVINQTRSLNEVLTPSQAEYDEDEAYRALNYYVSFSHLIACFFFKIACEKLNCSILSAPLVRYVWKPFSFLLRS